MNRMLVRFLFFIVSAVLHIRLPGLFAVVVAASKGGDIPGASRNNPWTLDLLPTGALVERDRRRRLGNKRHDEEDDFPPHWFDSRRNAVYASIPDSADPMHNNNSQLHDYHRYRHLSRYEIQLRRERGLDMQLDWNGTYDSDDWFMEDVLPNETLTMSSGTLHRTLSSQNHKGGQYNNYQAVPLSQGYGTHYANIWVGSPRPQRKTLIVDTGSHYTAFPCLGCKNCGANHHTDPYFDPSKSTTFHHLQCDECQDGIVCENGFCKFQQAYTEGSTWEAVQVNDRVYAGGRDVIDAVEPQDERYAINFMFGCQTSMTGLFVTQLADGIIGMSAHPATLPKRLYDNGKIEHNLFALCYRRELGTSRRGVHAGSMTLGGVSTSLDTSPIVYAKNLARGTKLQWEINMMKVPCANHVLL